MFSSEQMSILIDLSSPLANIVSKFKHMCKYFTSDRIAASIIVEFPLPPAAPVPPAVTAPVYAEGITADEDEEEF